MFETVYREIFENHCEAAEPEYLHWFQGEFAPNMVNWADENAAKGALKCLVREVCECFGNYEEVLEAYGLTQAMLN